LDDLDPFDPIVLNNNDARSEGHDIIQDFNHVTENDFIDLDALFDNLGIQMDDFRAYQVNIESNVITVEGVDNFSITVEGDALADVSASDNFDFDQLYDMGINVGGISFVPDES
jgi:alkyl sulfatase BDS1-like metallo-beta-lactamase superfamily hydrolase